MPLIGGGSTNNCPQRFGIFSTVNPTFNSISSLLTAFDNFSFGFSEEILDSRLFSGPMRD
jgi:hypothetical protein